MWWEEIIQPKRVKPTRSRVVGASTNLREQNFSRLLHSTLNDGLKLGLALTGTLGLGELLIEASLGVVGV